VPGGGAQWRVTANEFPISTTLSASVLEIEPGAMRELHWHPHADEWQYYLEGAAEMAVYLGMGHTVIEQFVTGDIGYVPTGAGHYIRNIGSHLARAARIQSRALSFPRPQRMVSLEPARCIGYQFKPATNGRGSAS
jgi:mannose-6-phosphate isomerase-like protein (cupin superfamily)